MSSSSAPISREYPATSAPEWRRDGGSGSCRFAHRQAPAREEKVAVLGLAKRQIAEHHLRDNGAQPGDDRARFVEPPHMG